MKMKNLTLVVAMILFSSCVTSQLLDATDDEDDQWWNSPYSPLSSTNGHHHLRPSPELAKCFADHKKVTKCLNKVFRKIPTVGSESSECCTMIKSLYEDCEKTVFGSFRNPFFNYYVKQHCATKVGPTPEAPFPA